MSEDSEGLVYRGALPVAIKKLKNMPSDYELACANHSNEVLLKGGLMLNDHQELDEYHELSPFLIKMDLKLNLLLNLMGEIIKSSNECPESRYLQLTPQCLTLEGEGNTDSLELGEVVIISVHLVAEMPKALSFYGIVSNATKDCRIDFLSLDQQVSDQLEKIIFRFHRRSIAQQKIAEQSVGNSKSA